MLCIEAERNFVLGWNLYKGAGAFKTEIYHWEEKVTNGRKDISMSDDRVFKPAQYNNEDDEND